MCGISALFSLKAETRPAAEVAEKLGASLDKIAHRGPDARGQWISRDGRVALGHCRLSINDLSADGDQPLHSDDEKIHAVVNGEIYDYDRIREELVRDFGYQFKGRSDSELVIALYKYWDLTFLSHLRGEFSLCLYDEQKQIFVAARDRYGIKPLFYTVKDDRALFAAEVKALVPLGWAPKWDIRSMIDGTHAFGDTTIFDGVRKLRPGHYMTCLPTGVVETRPYWEIDYAPKDKVEKRSEEEMIRGVRERLLEAIRLRLRADVPVGVYLSGGIDSSVIAGVIKHLVQEQGEKMGNKTAKDPLCCFSVAFDKSSGFDESDVAERTAEWLGVKTIKCAMGEAELAKHFEDATYHCEQASADLSYVGKHCLSKTARDEGYKVVLTGEGSDEHFAGYFFLQTLDYLREPDLALPHDVLTSNEELRTTLFATVQKSDQLGTAVIKGIKPKVEACAASRQLNNLYAASTMDYAQTTIAVFAPWVRERYAGIDRRDALARNADGIVRDKMRREWHPLHASMYAWTRSSLANYLLVNLGDRTEMAHSIEARTPFLDHHLTEYVNGLPPSVKMRYVPPPPDNSGSPQSADVKHLVEKWILREASKPYITPEVYARRKQPFLAPTKYPADGPLAQLFRRLLARKNVERLGFLDCDAVDGMLAWAFGENGDQWAMRTVISVAGWVVIGQKFDIPKAANEENMQLIGMAY